MRKVGKSREIVVFHLEDLPCEYFVRYGFSIHRGVLIQWDEDEDARILTFIDELPDMVRRWLVMASEHEAGLMLVWRDQVPPGYAEGDDVYVADDVWHISRSRAC